jgi:hypothetical protein
VSGLAGVPIHPGSPPADTRQLHFLTGVARTWQVDAPNHQITLYGAPLQVQRAKELCYEITGKHLYPQDLHSQGSGVRSDWEQYTSAEGSTFFYNLSTGVRHMH